LFADLLHIHPLLYKRSPTDLVSVSPLDAAEDAAALRERLSDALRAEQYEEAAALRLRLETLSRARVPQPDGLRGTTP
jgi:hypothetical protein